VLRLRLRPPYDSDAVGEFLAARAVDGLEVHEATRRGWTHRRVLPLPSHAAVVGIEFVDEHVVVRSDAALRDTAALVHRVRRWLDLDAEPATIAAALSTDAALAPLVARRPGLRVPTTVDAWETVVRAIVGQQVSVAGARTLLGRIVRDLGTTDVGGMRPFPTPAEVVSAGADRVALIGMPGARARSLHAVAAAVADGTVDLRSGDLDEVAAALLAVPGIGPWTVSYVRLRALGDPDVLPETDLGIRHGAAALGLPQASRALAERARAWSPWRSYAAQHLWTRPEEKS
jgi:AraC family transcriptional regulator of adaptative response / DNA-3-methyladenine glycosylase II